MQSNAKTVILVSHGQPSSPEPPEAALARLAERVAEHLPDWHVKSATLSTPGRLEHLSASDAVIYPFFMSAGWFTTQVLPKRLQGSYRKILPPFGLDAALPSLTATALAPQLQPGSSLLLAAHGSARGEMAAMAAEQFASRLAPLLKGVPVEIGYVEQDPTIAQVAKDLRDQSLCLPFFSQAGDHVLHDLPQSLAAAKWEIPILPVTGALPGVPRLIAKAIQAATEDP